LVTVVQQIAGVEDKTPPDFSGNRPPEYPSDAVRRKLEGDTMLRIKINSAGKVIVVAVVKSSGHRILDQAAIAAVRTWRGQPARRGGRPVEVEETLPVRFRLRD